MTDFTARAVRLAHTFDTSGGYPTPQTGGIDMATRRKNDHKGAEIIKGGQSAHYQELLTAENGDRLRVVIKADTYRFQCFARAQRWDGTEWKEVWHLDPLKMQTETNLAYVNRALTSYDFKLDRDRLLGLAAAVLGVKVRA